ncbi:MAG: ABC transporter permease [Methanobacteriaceae archaeon]|jgi:ABC-2 type transport system permease protein|nr:ABC transporter permease [Methanobacteriaceae archaeon]OPY24838.1 MAG: ABC-2 family transporter protein [Methanobacterium sp. PtaU1.Bin097]
MKILALSRKEAQDILNNKIYLLIIFVQVFIILGAFAMAIITAVAADPALFDSYGITSNLKVGVDPDISRSEMAGYLKEQGFTLIVYNSENATKDLGKDLVAVVENSSQGEVTVHIDNTNAFYPVVNQKINDSLTKYEQAKKLEAAGLNQSTINIVQNSIILTEITVNEDEKSPIAIDSSYFVEVMYGFIVPFVLLLPFFMASNIVTDSVVGERERKTFEVLLMAPLTSSMVIIGKTIPILSFSVLQSMAWILLLDLLKVPIYNPAIIFLILLFVGLGFIGVGIIISMLVDSTKEANSAITLALVFATFILFFPLFTKVPYFEAVLNFIPTVLLVKISSTPVVDPWLLLSTIPTILVSTAVFVLSVRYFRHERAIRL